MDRFREEGRPDGQRQGRLPGQRNAVRNKQHDEGYFQALSAYDRAAQAVRELETAGVPHKDISIVSNNSDSWYSDKGPTKRVDRDGDGVDDRAEGAGAGAGIGAGIGGAAGLLAGLGLLAIPGVGPVVAAGWLVATAAGAAAGGITGGIVGALTQAGVSDDDAQLYAEGCDVAVRW